MRPHVATAAEIAVAEDLDEGLTTYDASGAIVPGVAQSWTVSADQLTYTFTISAAARWSNGDPVTAADFVASFRRVEDPKEGAAYPEILYPVLNAAAINTATADDAVAPDTLGVRAVDPHTLEITLERPAPDLLARLAHPSALPVHAANRDQGAADFMRPGNLLSDGPFMLAENVAGDHLTLVRNPDYRDAAAIKLDQVVYYPTDDQAGAVRRFTAGGLDLVTPFPADQADALRKSLGADVVHVAPSLSVEYYVLDTRQPPLDDVRVRQSLALAIDRNAIAAGAITAESPLNSPVPPGIPGYVPALPDYVATSVSERVANARALLSAAGYGDGGKPLKLEIRYNAAAGNQATAAAIADAWKALGATVTLVAEETRAHYASLQQGGPFSVARAEWTATIADPAEYLSLFASADAAFNYGRYTDPKYDALLGQAAQATDPATRLGLLHDAEGMLVADQPVIPVTVAASPWLVSGKVHGWQDNAINVHLSRTLSLD